MKSLMLFLILLFTILVGNSQVVNVPDADFKSILLQHEPVIDINGDGEIQVSEAEALSNLYIRDFTQSLQVNSLEGLSSFTNITYLQIGNTMNISTITISDFQSLEVITVSDTSVNELIISNTPNLNNLGLYGAYSLSTLNLDNCQCEANLEDLSIEDTMPQFTSIDLSSFINLKTINLFWPSLTQLDLTNNINLEVFVLYGGSSIQNLNFDQNINLVNLYLYYRDDVDLDLSNNINLSLLSLNGFNNLINLDLSQNTSLGTLNFEDLSQLEFLNLKNGVINDDFIEYYGILDVDYICLDEDEIDFFQSNIFSDDSNSTVFNSYCSLTPGGDYYVINGENKVDTNLDGCDINDYLYPSLKFNIANGTNTWTYISNASGTYGIPLSPGTHTITPVFENSTYFSFSQNNVSVSFPQDTSPYNQDFCITPNGVYNDLELVIIQLSSAVPGFDASYKIIYKNKGNTSLSGSVDFDYSLNSDVVQFISASPTNDSEANNVLSWNFVDLAPFETREIEVTFNLNTPTDPIFPLNDGDELGFTATISPLIDDDETPSDNSFELKQTVVNSFDPNDIRCLEGEIIAPEDVGKYVHYLIRFENLGTASAVNVVVKNTIDVTKFDISTLVPIDGSHDYFTRINASNDVEFIFENIQLPIDDANNDGYLVYKIRTLQSLVLGDEFSTQAEIYFDFNAPVITNNYTTIIAEDNLGTSDYSLSKIKVYPNPVNDVLTVKAEFTIDAVSVYDIEGRKVLEVLKENVNQIDMSALRTGIYFVKVFSDLKAETLKVIKH
ncbi:DUF7619 domain-containing protein [Psychroserpens jangbogonensis]|uniref:DUF7619 domain-containing protein n=1 Tax=Psychroserpens jangbogonensis TaxID=1484460 RepID=UPI00053E1728|nr:T9SS type A sorting domain-containing protein [Psychroserpens jangbogonensis]